MSYEKPRWPLYTALAWVMTRDKRFTNQATINEFAPYVPRGDDEESSSTRHAWNLLFLDMKSGRIPVFGKPSGQEAQTDITIPPDQMEGLDWGVHDGMSALRVRAPTQDEDEHLSLNDNIKFFDVQVSGNAMVMTYLQQDEPIAFSTTQIGIAERPDGPDYMALSAAAYWIATNGGTFRFFARDEAVWRLAYTALLAQIIGGNVKCIGRVGGQGEAQLIEGFKFSGIAVNLPYTEPTGEMIFGDLPYLEPGQPVTTSDWQRDNDRLRFSGKRTPIATHLQVSKPDVAQLWSFAATKEVVEKTAEPQMVVAGRGKIPLLIKRLAEIYPEGVPPPSEAPRKVLKDRLLKTTEALLNSLDDATLKKAIDQFNASIGI